MNILKKKSTYIYIIIKNVKKNTFILDGFLPDKQIDLSTLSLFCVTMPCQQPFSYKHVCIYILQHKIVLIVFNRRLLIYQFASVENNCYRVQTNWIAFKLFITYSFLLVKGGVKNPKVYINNYTPQTAYYEKEYTLFLSCKLYT